MLLRVPANLHYPITITKIEKRAGEDVAKGDNVLLYSYTTKVKVGSRYDDEETEVDKKFVAHFESYLDGSIVGWRVWEGDTLDGPKDICEISEACQHTVQLFGMCANCGKDMTVVEAGRDKTDADRAPIRMAHDTPHLTISQEEASKIDEDAKRRLLKARKLSLVVDLDQTIIHAAVDPTIAEWKKDPENPNYEALKDVRSFQLVDDGPGMRGCWYYIKLRPGLQDFLDAIARYYELHIYTMGTRQYAQQIANLVDPDRRFFGDRILSRDESGSMLAKNLERLFPIDTKMVVIIDDRGDVWKWNSNLIRVTPFDFFVGIGDINSSFLPKKQEIQVTLEPEHESKEQQNEQNGHSNTVDPPEEGDAPNGNGTSALEQLVAMSGSDDPGVQELQSKDQEAVISSQLVDKPLLRLQREQDEKDGTEETVLEAQVDASVNGEQHPSQATESDSDSSDSNPSIHQKSKPRHSILKNDDEELVHLESSLVKVHEAFYTAYDKKRRSGKGGRVAELTGKKKPPLPAVVEDETTDLSLVPDVKTVMPSMKRRVLAGVTIVFSGVLPLGTDIQSADISTWAKTFGATVTDKVTRDVTHVVAARAGTAKVKQAGKRGVKVVGTPWLLESIQRWRRLDETPYLLEGAGSKPKAAADNPLEGDLDGDAHGRGADLTAKDFLLSSSEGETTGAEFETEDEAQDGQPTRKKLKIDTAPDPDKHPHGDEGDYELEGSPLTINQDEWADIDAELKEFMGSDVDSESDTDSVTSALSIREKSRKRRRGEEGESDDGGGGGGDGDGGPTRKVSKPNRSGESRLRMETKPDTTSADEVGDREIAVEQREVETAQERESAEEEDSDDELARELERELEDADENE